MTRFDRIRRQVPEHDAEYRALREAGPELSDFDTGRMFGEEILARIDNTAEGPEQAETEMEAEQELRTLFVKTFKELYMLYSGQIVRADAQQVLRAAEQLIYAPQMQKELREQFGDPETARFSPASLADAVMDGTISTAALKEAVLIHQERFSEQESELEHTIEAAKAEFIDSVDRGIAEGWLPEQARENLHRLDDVHGRLIDVLRSPIEATYGEIDQYDQLRINSVNLAPGNTDKLKHTLFHEFVHAIAGKSNSIVTDRDADSNERSRIAPRKNGIMLNQIDGRARFRWLNEAITEHVGLRLLGPSSLDDSGGYKGSRIYMDERLKMDYVIGEGVEEQVLLDAYFENFSSEQTPAQGKGEAFAQMVRSLNEHVEQGALLRLDSEFVITEITKTLECLPQAEPEVQSYLLDTGCKLVHIHVQAGAADNVRSDAFYVVSISGRDEFTQKMQMLTVHTMLERIQKKYGRQVGISTRVEETPRQR